MEFISQGKASMKSRFSGMFDCQHIITVWIQDVHYFGKANKNEIFPQMFIKSKLCRQVKLLFITFTLSDQERSMKDSVNVILLALPHCSTFIHLGSPSYQVKVNNHNNNEGATCQGNANVFNTGSCGV